MLNNSFASIKPLKQGSQARKRETQRNGEMLEKQLCF